MRGFVTVVGCVVALAAVSGAGAGGAGTAAQPTDAQIDALLESVGIDPSAVVVQRGLRNYAGPNCPGASWNCTSAKRVVQVAKAGGSNSFECRASPPAEPPDSTGPPAGPICVIVQTSASAQNRAWCTQYATTSPAILSCRITQFNSEGGNWAFIKQVVDQRSGAVQTADVTAFVDQETTGTGDDDDYSANHDDDDGGGANNNVRIIQEVGQLTTAAADQSQDAIFNADVTQDAVFGSNNCVLDQRLGQVGRSSLTTVNQTQDGDQFGEVFQENGEGEALSAASPSNGSSGTSNCKATQFENKLLVGKGTQTQTGPQSCCASEDGDSESRIEIRQTSSALASQSTAFQRLDTDGEYFGYDDGLIVHNLRINTDRITRRTSGPGPQSLNTACQTGSGCFPDEVDIG